jgi:hypothetical protein
MTFRGKYITRRLQTGTGGRGLVIFRRFYMEKVVGVAQEWGGPIILWAPYIEETLQRALEHLRHIFLSYIYMDRCFHYMAEVFFYMAWRLQRGVWRPIHIVM